MSRSQNAEGFSSNYSSSHSRSHYYNDHNSSSHRDYSNERSKGHYRRRTHYPADFYDDRPRKSKFKFNREGYKEDYSDSRHEGYESSYSRHGYKRSHSRSEQSEYYKGHKSDYSKDASRGVKEASPVKKTETPYEQTKNYFFTSAADTTAKETPVSTTIKQTNVNIEEPIVETQKMSMNNPEPSAFTKEDPQQSLLAELITNLRKSTEIPLEIKSKVLESIPEAPNMKQSLLLALVRTKQGSHHGEDRKKDAKWIKQELDTLFSLDRERLNKQRQELLGEIQGESVRKQGRRIVPKVRYWGKGSYTDKAKLISRKLGQMVKDDNIAELEIVKRDKQLAEMKLQITKTELKSRLVDLKIALRLS